MMTNMGCITYTDKSKQLWYDYSKEMLDMHTLPFLLCSRSMICFSLTIQRLGGR